jgi:hypothetical protein
MQSPYSVYLTRQRLVVLNEYGMDANVLESLAVVSLAEIAAVVGEPPRNDLQNTFKKRSLNHWKIHVAPFTMAHWRVR